MLRVKINELELATRLLPWKHFFFQKTVDYMMGVSYTSVITYTHIIYKRVINVFFFKGELSASLNQALR